MTQYNTLDVKFSNSRLNKLKSGRKNVNESTLNLSSNLIADSNDETRFLYKFEGFVKLLQMFIQVIQNYQNLSCPR